MATSKTIKPTNETVSIPAMTDRPNQSVNSNTMSKTIEGLNALYDSVIPYAPVKCAVSTWLSNLATMAGNMAACDSRVVRLHAEDTSAPFTANYFYGGLFVKFATNYWAMFLMNPETNTLVYGRYNNGTWTFRTVSTDAVT